MKKFILIIIFSFFLSGNVFAETIYCKIDSSFICNSNGCVKGKPETFINLDTERKTYQRGDSKGIDTYDMEIYKSGNFIIARVRSNASLKIDITDKNFVEVVKSGLVTFNNFGTCR